MRNITPTISFAAWNTFLGSNYTGEQNSTKVVTGLNPCSVIQSYKIWGILHVRQ